MKLGSLFDGSGGFPLAGLIHGITPVWASEIEPYPLKVTAARFPDMKQLGDVRKIDGAKIEPVDVITFGSPCQDLSVAGKQKGIHDGERSSLFFEAIRIIKEMRNATANEFPRFAVWENVPGAFSSNKGNDFLAVLQAFCEIKDPGAVVPVPETGRLEHAGSIVGNGYSIAWRVYDAQFWGVPQRRKRIYLIADFGSERAGEILFKPESVRRNPAESGETGQGIAADAQGSAGRSDRVKCLNPWGSQSARQFSIEGAYCTLQSRETSGLNRSGVCYPAVARSLCARHDSSPCLDRGQNIICFMGGQGAKAGSIAAAMDKAPTLKAAQCGSNRAPDVCYLVTDCRGRGDGATDSTLTGDHNNRVSDYTTCVCERVINFANYANDGTCSTLRSRDGKQTSVDLIVSKSPGRKYIVRRLTPTEHTRLQGFPDWWCDGADGSDSAKYKMWGNGIALPCAADVLGRIAGEKEGT